MSAEDVAATAASIVAMQEPDGGVPWPDGHVDAWNHIECAMALSVAGRRTESRRAYGWLLATQRPDGTWPAKVVRGAAADPAAETNHAAYIAVGVWHELLLTGDDAFVRAMWPAVRLALDFVVDLQTARGEIVWERGSDMALLTGCSSIYQGLRCGALLGEHLGDHQPDWELAADQLGHVLRDHPEAFADKSRWSMDWYYPILGGALRGPAAAHRMDSGWDTFVVPELGVRCVSDQPWVTGAETCELVMALDTLDDPRAHDLFARMQFLRHADGSYWTGWQFANQKHFPHEQSSYTAAAVILAADALSRTTPASGLFRMAGERVPEPNDTSACGCAPSPPSGVRA